MQGPKLFFFFFFQSAFNMLMFCTEYSVHFDFIGFKYHLNGELAHS